MVRKRRLIKKRKDNRTSPTTRAVMRALYVGRRRWQTTNEVSERAGVSWVTARDKLNKLYRGNKVSKKRRSGRTYWKI